MHPFIRVILNNRRVKLRDVRSCYETLALRERSVCVKRAENLQLCLEIITFVTMLRIVHIDSQHPSVVLGGGNSLIFNNLIINKAHCPMGLCAITVLL